MLCRSGSTRSWPRIEETVRRARSLGELLTQEPVDTPVFGGDDQIITPVAVPVRHRELRTAPKPRRAVQFHGSAIRGAQCALLRDSSRCDRVRDSDAQDSLPVQMEQAGPVSGDSVSVARLGGLG